MATFTYDGKTIPFEAGESIIAAAARQGIEIPHYCWHPGLSAPANCRMCLVEILPGENQRAVSLDIVEWDEAAKAYKPAKKPKLLPSCQMQAQDGMVVKGDSSEHVREARKSVQEFLLLNHPVDCPICDQSGECKLQDYWLEHGQFEKRMRDEPVHKPKAVEFGPTIVYDAERCVMCTRCIRFMDEVAHDPVLSMRERGNLNEIVVAPGRELAGNYTFMTEHVCPVGALTTKDFRFKARVWFLKSAKSVCQGCSTGCNAHLDYDPRYNKAYRYRPRDNMAVNKYWMCDPGMLSFHEAHEGRVIEPRSGGKTVSLKKALAKASSVLEGVDASKLAIVLGAGHSIEDNWAMHQLGSVLLGASNVYVSGRANGEGDDILMNADKNSNRAGVREIAPAAKPFETLVADVGRGAITHALVLGGHAPLDQEALQEKLSKLEASVVVAAHEGGWTRVGQVVLPAASWAEAAGTFVNAKGHRQVSDRALEPQGSSREGWRLIGELGVALGLDAGWTSLKQVRGNLAVMRSERPPPPAPTAGV